MISRKTLGLVLLMVTLTFCPQDLEFVVHYTICKYFYDPSVKHWDDKGECWGDKGERWDDMRRTTG